MKSLSAASGRAPASASLAARPKVRLAPWLAGVALLLLLLPSYAATATRPTVTQESDLEAAFLFHFTQFVDWPREAFADEHAPFVVGILGDDPFRGSLDEILANESVGGHRVVVRRYPNADSLDACHVLFISRSEAGRSERVFAKLEGHHVLTVGDTKDFAVRHGVIGFVASHDRLRLRINLTEASAAKLTISSKLLRQAELVGGEGRGR